jgi:hypothetical protein
MALIQENKGIEYMEMEYTNKRQLERAKKHEVRSDIQGLAK